MAEYNIVGRVVKEKTITGSINKGIGMGELPQATGLSEFPSPAYSVNGKDLESVGNAIAEKAGVEKPVWPDGFVEAVSGPQYPDAYVTEGLYLHLDAFENTRNGYSETLPVWEDISGNQNDFALAKGAAFPTNLGVLLNKTGGYMAVGAIDKPVTAEVVFLSVGEPRTQTILAGYGNTNDSCVFSISNRNGQASLGACCSPNLSAMIPQYETVCASAIPHVYHLAINGKAIRPERKAEGWGVITNQTFGCYNPFNGGDPYFYVGYLMSLRFYNRVLTQEEIMQNQQRDMRRFGRTITVSDVIQSLPDLGSGTKTMPLGSEALAQLSVEEIAEATDKGWTLA